MDDTEHLVELFADVRTVMLTTVEDGSLVARPMAVEQRDFDGELWLIASRSSPKARQVEADPQVGIVSMAKDAWVSVEGTAELVDDRDRLRALWNPFVEAWFPDGPDDPDVTLIHVTGERAEYWDANGGRVTTALKMLRAAVTKTPPTDVGENAKVDLQGR